MLKTRFTILCVLAGLLLPVAAFSQYAPPGNPFLGGDDPCEDDFLIPTLGSGQVQVQQCPSGGSGGGGGTTPPGGTTGNGGGGGGGSATSGGGRRPAGNQTYKGRRLIPATPAPDSPLSVTPLPAEEGEPVLIKPVWDPLRRPRIRRVVPGMPLPPPPLAETPGASPPPRASQQQAGFHGAAPLPATGAPLFLLIAMSLGAASLSGLRKHSSPPPSP